MYLKKNECTAKGCALNWTKSSHLFKRLQQVAPRDRQSDVHVVHDEKRLILRLVWEAGQVVRHK